MDTPFHSLAIDVTKVYEVLLADGWHTVYRDSFMLASFNFHRESKTEFESGLEGFEFKEGSSNKSPRVITGPVSSILALRLKE